MPDDICFTAKLVGGYIPYLVEKGVECILYSIVVKEEKEFGDTNSTYNCPVISGYPDIVCSAVSPYKSFAVLFDKPVITFYDKNSFCKTCEKYFLSLGITSSVFEKSFRLAPDEYNSIKK
jgi:predicted nucleotide-binding protein (sugar kinase/HSP70/actin superfamily)